MLATTKPHTKTDGDRQLPKPVKKQIEEDAMELAQIIYDVYKEELSSAKITNGQNDAQTTNS